VAFVAFVPIILGWLLAWKEKDRKIYCVDLKLAS
jgi:hypothetical protein